MSFEIACLLEFSQTVGKGTEQGHLRASRPCSLLKAVFDCDAELLEIGVKFLAIRSTFGRCSASGGASHLLNERKAYTMVSVCMYVGRLEGLYIDCLSYSTVIYSLIGLGLIILPGCRVWSLFGSWASSRLSSRRQMAAILASLKQGLSC